MIEPAPRVKARMVLQVGQLLDALPDMVWTATPDGVCNVVNRRWREYTGLSLAEAQSQGWLAAVHPDDRSTASAAWTAARLSEPARDFDLCARLRRFDGVYRRVSLQVRALHDPDGGLTGWCGTTTDVSQRLEDLRLIGTGLDLPGGASRFADAVERVRRTRSDFDVTYRIVTPADGVRHLRTVSTQIPEITERRLYVGSTQDVTASRLAEAELARANTYLEAAHRLGQTGSFTGDVIADEHYWSDAIYEIFGFAPGIRVTQEMMLRSIHPDDHPAVLALLTEAYSGEDVEIVFRVIHASGETRFAHVVGRRIDQTRDRPVFMGALQDITARKLADDDLNRARLELAHLSRAAVLGALTASIAHEVSQPLTGVLTNAGTTQRWLSAEPPNIDQALATVQRTLRDANRASGVLKGLRALFSRKPPSFEPVDLREATDEVLLLTANELERRDVILHTEFAADLPPVQADRIQIQQVILNLVLNAADAMTGVYGRRPTLLVSIRRAEDGGVRLDVRDNGSGVDSDAVEALFQAFHTTKTGGMGIGLSISRSIVEAHGGRLYAAPNIDGPGTTFSVVLPREAQAGADSTPARVSFSDLNA